MTRVIRPGSLVAATSPDMEYVPLWECGDIYAEKNRVVCRVDARTTFLVVAVVEHMFFVLAPGPTMGWAWCSHVREVR